VIIEDFTLLGTTVPESTRSDGRICVCSAGVSPESRKLIRLYPLARRHAPSRWNTYRVPVERNPKDHRPESFKLQGDRSDSGHPYINNVFTNVGEVKPTERAQLLRPFIVGSIKEANEKRLSLAILQPDFGALDFDYNPDSPDSPQLALFPDLGPEIPVGAKRFPYIPRLNFYDEVGPHRLMIRDWGVYEQMRKYPGRHRELPHWLHLSSASSLLVGNFNQHRSAWLIISVLNGLRDSQPTLFDYRPKIPAEVRTAVFERDHHQCQDCGADDDLTLHHIRPWSQTFDDSITNLRVLCRECNSKRGDWSET
jgi:hypothetical protein